MSISYGSSHTFTKKICKFLGELRIFLTIFLVSFLCMVVFTNADMFWEALFVKDVTLNQVQDTQKIHLDAQQFIPVDKSIDLVQEVDRSIQQYGEKNLIIDEKDFLNSEGYLKDTKKDQAFDFNVLPPTDRIVIPSIGLDAPVIDSKVNNIMSFKSEDFDDVLMSGVVKYPTTPVPGTNGNTFLFGHTSQEWWKNNDYSTVFNKLPKLKNGDIISVIWEGKLYNYKMVDKRIVYPKQVEGVYQEYQTIDEDYVTLMGCYPLGSARKRILIIAKRVS